MSKKEYLEQLKTELEQAGEGFLRTETGKIIKSELSKLGYWRNKPRGNPKKGYKNSPEAQKHKF